MRLLLSFLLLLPALCYSQEIFYSRGTIIFGAITEQGIVMLSDTRSSLYLSDDKHPFSTDSFVAYYDKTRKIHVIHDWLIGIAGSAEFNGYRWEFITRLYTKETHAKQSIKDEYYQWIDFLQRRFNSNEKGTDNEFLLGGIENGRPAIYLNSIKSMPVIDRQNEIYYTAKGQSLSTNTELFKYVLPNSRITVDLIASTFCDAFQKIGKDKPKLFVGGPCSIYKMDLIKQITKVSTFDEIELNSEADEVKGILSGKIPVSFFHPEKKNRFFQHLKSYNY